MQHRSEHLAFEAVDAVDFDQRGRKESAARGICRQAAAMQHLRFDGHARDVRIERGAGLLIDCRPDVRGKVRRVADLQFVHVPDQ